ncbi:hypothetical protein [Mycolicibacterium goodii]|uniref:Secreted protein n=1 Tax=Mycolicibacterium goodii TaxID=134601 RepID=A0ABS6HNC9_MYCGD|nr:hypothetical protein [Mycolicibacterium goodii]YP_009013566.1 hypothetical protein DORI_16 [Mycobacterium phage Dori]UVT31449.1 hypothetical protein SEA_SEJANUS_16 [Mycobacterium phage Sejanus]UVT31549.1 hypothetical protein SEA_MASK_16 [Mycobacterium phage Mask]AER47667.1 hypothetical protein DORI_16 [Mycobacterium phage Dori]MBU8824121.1 hypothetical protein [Mycolicibacterium goodii]MBU8838096.1 hypothetical protein [Mycolicibacterium goodii]
MTAELVLVLLGSAGFLSGVAGLLAFLNTRKSTRSKGSAEAYQAYEQFVNRALGAADGEHSKLLASRDRLYLVRATLIDLVQDLLRFARKLGADPDELETFQDRLDEVRRL